MKESKKETTGLVRKAVQGDATAFDSIYKLTWPNVMYSAFKVMGNKQDAEEVCQETYLVAYKEIGLLRSPEAFHSWLYRILMNNCNKALTKRGNNANDMRVDIENYQDVLKETKTEYLPEAFVSEKEVVNQVLEAINNLSPQQRAAVIMFYYQQMSYEEIAVASEISKEGVESRLRRARAAIKQYIKQSGAKSALFSMVPSAVIVESLCEEANHLAFLPSAVATFLAGGATAASGTGMAIGSAVSGTAKTAVLKFAVSRIAAHIPAILATTAAGVMITAATVVGINNRFAITEETPTSFSESFEKESELQISQPAEEKKENDASTASASSEASSGEAVMAPPSSVSSGDDVQALEIRTLADMIGEADAAKLQGALPFTLPDSEKTVKDVLTAHEFSVKSSLKEGLDVYEGSYLLYFMEKGDKRLLAIVRTDERNNYIGISIAITTQQEDFPKEFSLMEAYNEWKSKVVS